MGVGHYENFPVASLLLPARLRRPVAAIYRFARTADDFADEGDVPTPKRLRRLAQFDERLRRLERGERFDDVLFSELSVAIEQHRLPFAYFHDLIDAFSQDCVKSRYESFAELQDYARRSADPVGRLLLHVFDACNAETLTCSDRICSALQFINFWQDVGIDYRKRRIYLPREDMQAFDVTEADIEKGTMNPNFRALMRFQVERTRSMLHAGASLGRLLPGRIGLEIRMVVAGGDTILQKLIEADFDIFRRRPVLRAADWLSMLYRAMRGDGRVAT
ncbi:MAG: squalene synthase HpnC [Burkholderiales bacterium]|nr:squalene synthase HpnC [Burkholderiales bacterium]